MMYWFYRAFAKLPLWLCYPLATAAAWLTYRVFRYRRHIILNNLRAAFPEQSDAWRHAQLKAFYSGLADTTLEIIFSRQLSLADFKAHVHYENPEVLRSATANFTRSALVLTLHQGNWEWMLHGATAEFDIRIDPVYKRLHNAGADRFTLETRSQFGSKPILMQHVARNVLKHRREPRIVVLVADQSPGQRERVHWTTFLNQTTAFFSGGATIAQATDMPIVFAVCQRQARGQYTVRLEMITAHPQAMDAADIIARYAELTEREVRRRPADWLWSNRRWKLAQITHQKQSDQAVAATESESVSDKSSQAKPSP